MMREDMTPEDELCLLLARGQLPPQAEGRARELLARPLRWAVLAEQARTHEVLPLVWRNLRAFESTGVPDDVTRKFQEGFRINHLRSTLLAQELARVLRLLAGAGVAAVPLKGITLAEALYGDAGLRVSFDIDLLVRHREAARARRLLLGKGYSSPFTEQFFVAQQLRTSADCCLMPGGRQVPCPLDLRWSLLRYSSKDRDAMDDLWAEVCTTAVLGVPAGRLSAEWEFLYLAAHAASHGWQLLKGLVDIHEVCGSARVDWDRIREKADRLELARVVEWTLSACACLFDTPVPPPFARRPLPGGVRLFPAHPASAGSWQAAGFHRYVLQRPADRLRWLAGTLCVPSEAEYELLRLPSSLSFLYYPLRPLRLATKWSWQLLRGGLARLG